MKKALTAIRIILIFLAIALVLIPALLVMIADKGFRALTANILLSLSCLCAIGAIIIGINKTSRQTFFIKVGVCVGLLVVLLSFWI